jgi:hypothetical protein
MTWKRWVAVIGAGIATISLGSVAAVYFSRPNLDQLDEAIGRIGFYPITPPSNLRGPGSIYHVSGDGKSYVMLCEVTPDRLKRVLRSSPTAKQVSSELSKARIGLQADLISRMKSTADADLLQSVKLELDDVEVAEVSLEELAIIAHELLQREACSRQVTESLRAGDYVCQGQQVLKATTMFSVAFKNTGAATVTNKNIDERAKAIQAHVAADAKVEGDRIVSGRGLYYGIKLAPRCMYLPGGRAKRPPLTVWQRWLNAVGFL